jgi:uncharacterized membrane protein (UPF0182 family)
MKKLRAVDFQRNFIKYFASCTAQNSSFLGVAGTTWQRVLLFIHDKKFPVKLTTFKHDQVIIFFHSKNSLLFN